MTDDRTRRLRGPRVLWLLLLAVLALCVGCAGRGEPGPRFGGDGAPMPSTRPGGGILYVYRADQVRTPGRAKVRVGEQMKATLQDREYLFVHLPAGRHELSMQFRGFPWSWGWDRLPFDLLPGQALFLRLQATTVRTVTRAGHLEEDTGPGNERFNITLTRGFVEPRVALPELRESRRTPDLKISE